jgi:two-component system nitrate/nitrite response regulator NarL
MGEAMLAVVIVSADPALRRRLEDLLRADRAVTIVGVAAEAAAARALMQQTQVDAILADAAAVPAMAEWTIAQLRKPVIALLDAAADAQSSLEAIGTGVRAVLPRSAGGEEILAALRAVSSGLVVLPHELVPMLLDGASHGLAKGNGAARLTARELEVLGALADGASNKAIARRLGISFHTAKFHVAAILAKLDADSRTEAVTKAAQLGLVML